MKKQFFAVSLLLCLAMSPTMQAIKENTAKTASFATGVVSFLYLSRKIRLPFAALGSALLGGGTYAGLSRFTSEGYLKQINSIISRLNNNPATMPYTDKKDCLNALQIYYVSDDLWLIAAQNDLGYLLKQARVAKELLTIVKDEEKYNEEVINACDKLLPHIEQAANNISAALHLISEHEQYDKQLRFSHEKGMVKAAQYLAIPVGAYYGFKVIGSIVGGIGGIVGYMMFRDQARRASEGR